jgi:hypothetical protein
VDSKMPLFWAPEKPDIRLHGSAHNALVSGRSGWDRRLRIRLSGDIPQLRTLEKLGSLPFFEIAYHHRS